MTGGGTGHGALQCIALLLREEPETGPWRSLAPRDSWPHAWLCSALLCSARLCSALLLTPATSTAQPGVLACGGRNSHQKSGCGSRAVAVLQAVLPCGLGAQPVMKHLRLRCVGSRPVMKHHLGVLGALPSCDRRARTSPCCDRRARTSPCCVHVPCDGCDKRARALAIRVTRRRTRGAGPTGPD